MQRKHHPIIPFLHTGLCAALLLGAVALVRGEDQKTDPTGTWSWTTPGRNGGPDRKMTLKLKLEGDKVTGKLVTPGRGDQTTETEIKDGKIKDGEVSFSVTRERGGNTMVTKYTFKVSGDTIKGKTSMERNGEAGTQRDWEAKRDKTESAK
jgi:hypothetical protein